jgi:hypothetical protein
MFWQGWTERKPGEDHDQNEDAYETRLVPDVAGDEVLLAICDGAGSTMYAGPWARALAAAAEPDWPDLDDAELTARLDKTRGQFEPASPDDLPWYMAHKLTREGSQATFLVVAFTPTTDTGEVGLRAVAVGDCTLVVFRCDGPVTSFPILNSDQFGLNPRLVSTKPQPRIRYDRWDASVKPGDLIVACTDAVGKWILEGVESADQASIFRLLLGLLREDCLQEPGSRSAGSDLLRRIAENAPERQLREDDLTVVLCVPTSPFSKRAPRDFAVAAVESHLYSKFDDLVGTQPGRRSPVDAVVSWWQRFYGRYRPSA